MAEQSVHFPTKATAPAHPEAKHRALDRATILNYAIPVILLSFALALLLVRLGQHPAYAYNWESYTSWRFFSWWDNPSTSIFELNDGLMTDSGASPLLAPIIWLSFKVFGVGLFAMRIPVALVTAMALPLTWVVGRRLVGDRAAVLAAVLLGLLPSFLIYGRTATNVGISLVPFLITVYLLIRTLKEPHRSQWLALLQLMLVLNSYAYSPIRFLWPISIALFVAELIFQRDARRRLAIGLLVTIVTLPLVLAFIEPEHEYNPLAAIGDYYYARGEQVFAWDGDPELYKFFLEPTTEEVVKGQLLGSEEELAWRLVKKNGRSLTNLLLDRDTEPAIIQFWNPHGRLYFGFLAPFFLLGLLQSLWNVRRRTEDRVLQGCVWGFSLPLLLTSQIHIGRLVFVLPFVCFFVASGLFWLVDFFIVRWRNLLPRSLPATIAAGAAVLLVVATARASWVDYRDALLPTRDERIISQLSANAGEIAASGGNAVLIRAGDNPETEAITVSTYRLRLDDTYRFVNLRTAIPERTDAGKPAIFFGLLLPFLDNPESVPSFCENTYFVDPELVQQFKDQTSDDAGRCGHTVRYVELVN
jgi:4-amino-4-deoxy-L-arabinose transferase-like glycosyltransferase